jgi:hypothetical protein
MRDRNLVVKELETDSRLWDKQMQRKAEAEQRKQTQEKHTSSQTSRKSKSKGLDDPGNNKLADGSPRRSPGFY